MFDLLSMIAKMKGSHALLDWILFEINAPPKGSIFKQFSSYLQIQLKIGEVNSSSEFEFGFLWPYTVFPNLYHSKESFKVEKCQQNPVSESLKA